MRKLSKEQRDELRKDCDPISGVYAVDGRQVLKALDDLDTADRELDSANRKLENREWATTELVKKHGEQLDELRAKLAEAVGRVGEWGKQVGELRAKLAEAEAKVEKLHLTNDHLHADLADAQKELGETLTRLAEIERQSYGRAPYDEVMAAFIQKRDLCEELAAKLALADNHAACQSEEIAQLRESLTQRAEGERQALVKLAEAEAHYNRAYANGWNDAKERESAELEALRLLHELVENRGYSLPRELANMLNELKKEQTT